MASSAPFASGGKAAGAEAAAREYSVRRSPNAERGVRHVHDTWQRISSERTLKDLRRASLPRNFSERMVVGKNGLAMK